MRLRVGKRAPVSSANSSRISPAIARTRASSGPISEAEPSTSDGHPAAIDIVCSTGHKAVAIGAQPHYLRANLAGLAHAAELVLRHDPLAATAHRILGHLRLDEPGADRVDANVRVGVFERGGLCQADDPMLRRDIGRR